MEIYIMRNKLLIHTLVLSILAVSITGCANNKPNHKGVNVKNVGYGRCGLDNDLVTSVVTEFPYRGFVNGARDEDHDGKVDADEAFTMWDFNQLNIALNIGDETHSVSWTNIDTCYHFRIYNDDVFEDKSQPAIWQTCRTFMYVVHDEHKKLVGVMEGKGCRNFATHEWHIF